MTPTGLKPWKKKIDAILKMDCPRNAKQLKSFLGSVNFYRDMWPSRAHILKPLTDLTGKTTFDWTAEATKAFEKMKAILAMDVLTAYPDHNKPFHIFTDSSDYQMGACIMQKGANGKLRPVAYYSKKLTQAQVNYTTMEKELLSIVSTLKEFRSMLLGSELHYIPGPVNVLADNLSRLDCMPDLASPLQIMDEESKELSKGLASLDSFYSIFDDKELVDCLVNLPALTYSSFSTVVAQARAPHLQSIRQKSSSR